MKRSFAPFPIQQNKKTSVEKNKDIEKKLGEPNFLMSR